MIDLALFESTRLEALILLQQRREEIYRGQPGWTVEYLELGKKLRELTQLERLDNAEKMVKATAILAELTEKLPDSEVKRAVIASFADGGLSTTGDV